MKKKSIALISLMAVAILGAGFLFLSVNCGSGLCTGGDEAAALGIGGSCAVNEDCQGCYDSSEISCLTNFKGGYCGVVNCTSDADCPESSICVTHDDNINYCFLICSSKEECNVYRGADEEANCSSSINPVGNTNYKACVPPSGTM
ncbi:MAG: hypothetical protein OEZ13_00040 [Spirochaetia bacterium]|nr:hypothetical protein [Spirochaetia bacterium]